MLFVGLVFVFLFPSNLEGKELCSPFTCQDGVDETSTIQHLLTNCSVVELFGTCNAMPLSISNTFNKTLIIHGRLLAARKWFGSPFFSASQVTNLLIGGSGVVDGQGHLWWTGSNKTPGRPILMLLTDCVNVVVENLNFLNSAFYHLYITGHDYVLRNLTVKSPDYLVAPNTDGLDIGASNVHVSNCHIKNGDDSICIKEGASNILVENSVVEQGAYVFFVFCRGGRCQRFFKTQGNGLVIGTGNLQSRNITFRNCESIGTLYGVNIKFKENQTGFLSDVVFESIRIKLALSAAIQICQQHQNCPSSNEPSNVTVQISNITYRDVEGFSVFGDGARLMCSKKFPCFNITMENVKVSGIKRSCVVDHVDVRCTNSSLECC